MEEKNSPSILKAANIKEIGDVKLYGASLHDLFKDNIEHGFVSPLTFTSPNGNRVIYDGRADINSLKRSRIYFNGKNNLIHITSLNSVFRLDIACIGNSSASIKSPNTVRGATIVASHGANIDIGADCMISRDVVFYASGAHGLYNTKDGAPRGNPNITISEHVWIGQGARILGGARVGSGSVIGSYSILAGRIPNNCAAAGNPCRVTSKDIFWSPETISENYFDYLKNKGKPLPDYIKMTNQN